MLMPAAIPAVAITATPAETWPVKVVHALEEMKELLSNCKTCDLNKYGSCGSMVSIFMEQLFNLGLTFKSKYRRDPNSKNTCFTCYLMQSLSGAAVHEVSTALDDSHEWHKEYWQQLHHSSDLPDP